MKTVLLLILYTCLAAGLYAYKHFRKRTDDPAFAVIVVKHKLTYGLKL